MRKVGGQLSNLKKKNWKQGRKGKEAVREIWKGQDVDRMQKEECGEAGMGPGDQTEGQRNAGTRALRHVGGRERNEGSLEEEENLICRVATRGIMRGRIGTKSTK